MIDSDGVLCMVFGDTYGPANGIAVDGRMFLHYFSAPKDWMAPGRGFNYASIAYSDDRGYTWKPVPWRWDRGATSVLNDCRKRTESDGS